MLSLFLGYNRWSSLASRDVWGFATRRKFNHSSVAKSSSASNNYARNSRKLSNVKRTCYQNWTRERFRVAIKHHLYESCIPDSVHIVFPTGESIELEDVTFKTVWDVYRLYYLQLHPGSPDAIGFAKKQGDEELVLGISCPICEALSENAQLIISKWIGFDDPRGRDIFWKTSALVLGAAIESYYMKSFKKKPPSLTSVFVENSEKSRFPLLLNGSLQPDGSPGFYYDVYVRSVADSVNLEALNLRFKSIVESTFGFEKLMVPKSMAFKIFSYNPLKSQYISQMPVTHFSICKMSKSYYLDISDHYHLPSFRLIKSFKITHTSSYEYRPEGEDCAIPMLRIHGISYPSQYTPPESEQFYHINFNKQADLEIADDLEQNTSNALCEDDSSQAVQVRPVDGVESKMVEQSSLSPPLPKTLPSVEEGQKLHSFCSEKDHRTIGKQLKLFIFDEHSPGSVFFLPHGMHIFNKLVDVMRKQCKDRGYNEVMTPTIFHSKIWETSGHLCHYEKNMFFINEEKSEHVHYGLKPMNCPGHCIAFASDVRSYRNMPIRYSEYSTLYRNELTGAISGLTRLIKFHQDDAHIFCTSSQIESELNSLINLISYIYKTIFKLEYEVYVSTRPENRIGDNKDWNQAEDALISILEKRKLKYHINEGDGAFYGPKIDFSVVDSLSRKHQCATIQIDFQLPQKFKLYYIDESGERKHPVMIHRAIFGSVERIFAMLVENYEGNFPLWISPRQIAICVVGDTQNHYAEKVYQDLKSSGYEVELFNGDETLPKKIVSVKKLKFNYIVVIGKEEVDEGNLCVRLRNSKKTSHLKLSEFKAMLQEEIKGWK